MSVEVISLKPDDVLVVQCETPFSKRDMKIVKRAAQKEFGHKRVAVVSPFVKLAVVKSDA
jgi:hypothetical protein